MWQGALIGKPILATTSWLFVTFDTAGEVPAALVRCRGVEKIWCLDVEGTLPSLTVRPADGGWRHRITRDDFASSIKSA
jgi:hypothetical protein